VSDVSQTPAGLGVSKGDRQRRESAQASREAGGAHPSAMSDNQLLDRGLDIESASSAIWVADLYGPRPFTPTENLPHSETLFRRSTFT
jgi:hypothetical protein